MGVSIDLHYHKYDELVEEIKKIAEKSEHGRDADYFIENILPEYGILDDNKTLFVTIWNEYYQEYNPATMLLRVVDQYFGVEDTFLRSYNTLSVPEPYDILEEHGIEPIGSEEEY